MTGSVVFTFKASTMEEAVETTLTKWRVLCDDPEATLPWSARVEMELRDGESQFYVTARVEFDQATAPAAKSA